MNHTHLAYNQIDKDDKVLDVGGAAQPFNRANFVIDLLPYEERNEKNTFFLKNIDQRFSKDTWIQQNICDDTKPFPFRDKEFDFVICGHTLEDLYNPFHVLREMQRVGKRGYIEVPSRFYEQLPGLEHKKMCGASHHHWIIELEKDENNKKILVFRFKNHLIHFSKKYRLKKPLHSKHFPFLNPNFEVLGIFWENEINFCEKIEETAKGDMSFFENTVELSKKIGKELWDTQQPIPIELSKKILEGGMRSVIELKNITTIREPIFNKNRQTTTEIKKYEEKYNN